ncbi:MAG TPA: flippase-like domain-containing protein [Firmicutes bacterium]|nr:flippase-like domain-containing protein [Bacillota bacterium]
MMFNKAKNPLHKIKKQLLAGLAVGIFIIAALMFAADFGGVLGVFASMDLRFLPLILLLAPLNYFFRFIKWNYYLKLSGLFPAPRMNRYIFMSGLSMTITPGKLGELVKCYLLKEHLGAPFSKTSSIVMAERVTDGLSIVILASLGLLAYPYAKVAIPIAAAILLLFVLIFYFDRPFTFVLGKLGNLAGIVGTTWNKADLARRSNLAVQDELAKLTEQTRQVGRIKKFFQRCLFFLANFQRSAKTLLSPASLLFAVGIGVVSWGFEGFVVFLAVKALGGEISVLASFFVVSFSSLLGALFFLPGGLGIAEGSIMAILLQMGIGSEIAAATTIITRFSTLWLGVFIGIVGLALVQKELTKT